LELDNTSEPTAIVGPAAGVTIDGSGISGDFQIDPGADVSMSGMAITGGMSSFGGGVQNNGTATLTDCTVSGNTATGNGGGIGNFSNATATLTDCTVTGNSAPFGGGGIDNSGGTVTLTNCILSGNTTTGSGGGIGDFILGGSNRTTATLTDCTISGNTAATGGGIYNDYATTTVTDCAVSGNTAVGRSFSNGGGISNRGGTLTLTDSTVANNSSPTGKGGAIYNDVGDNRPQDALTVVADCTLSGNSATAGGGVYNDNTSPATAFSLANTIIAGNTASAAGPDADGAFGSSGFNLVGQTDGSTGWGFDDFTGTAAHPLAAKLGPLVNNGGPTQTLLPLAGSPAIDRGDNALVPAGITTDQRGLPRVSNGTVDIGAVEVQATTPIRVTAPASQSAMTGQSQLFALGSFTESKATGPFTVHVHWGDGSVDSTFTVAAAGKIPATAHAFTFSENAVAIVSVTDSAGHASNSATFPISVTGPSALVVNSASDTAGGPGVFTLRDAIAIADGIVGPTTIKFDPSVFAKSQTITLDGSPLELNGTGPLTITGPAAGVTIDGNQQSGEIVVQQGVVSLTDMTFTNGEGDGVAADGTTTLTDCTISKNSGTGVLGGAILIGCTVSGNSDGGISSVFGATTTLTDCTVSGNTSTADGGGIFSNAATVTLTDCTVSGNTATGAGGGIASVGFGAATLTLTDSTVSGNTAASGGGIYNAGAGTATLNGCTVSGNTATGNGGGIDNTAPAASFTLANTIVAGNTAPAGPDADGPFSSLGFNLIGKTDASTGWVKTDLTGTTAKPLNADLGALANNGGPTLTMLPLPGSPATGHGSVALVPKGITTDQRGLPRILGGKTDIGAVELQKTSVVIGTVFYDANGDGIQDNGEAGLRGVQIYDDLKDLGYFVTGDPTTTTNATGGYTLAGVPAGNDIIRQVRPLGYAQTSPANGAGGQVTAAAGQTISGQNFGDRSAAAAPAAITGTVFDDANGDGTPDHGEAGLAGVQVYLDPGNLGYFVTGDPTALTNANGTYTLSGLAAGSYIVRQALPLGYVQTAPSRGLGDHVTVSAGQTLSGQDFGDMSY
jgi:parallel beta-helix repeat protein